MLISVLDALIDAVVSSAPSVAWSMSVLMALMLCNTIGNVWVTNNAAISINVLLRGSISAM